MVGRIFDIQRFSVHDGPGIRTTVFMKGCPLRCKWCHNPEGLIWDKQVKYVENECIHCNLCGNRSIEEVKNCPTGALQVCGRDLEANLLVEEILADKIFYQRGGGLSFSGGECLLQADFVREVLMLCKAQGLHTCVDTSGLVPFSELEKTLEFCDLYLYDIKCMSSEKHKEFTGCSNAQILENIQKLSNIGQEVWIRIPVIPGFNDTKEEMEEIAKFLTSLDHKYPVTLIPYHGLGSKKYESLGLEYSFDTKESMGKERIKEFAEVFEGYGISVQL